MQTTPNHFAPYAAAVVVRVKRRPIPDPSFKIHKICRINRLSLPKFLCPTLQIISAPMRIMNQAANQLMGLFRGLLNAPARLKIGPRRAPNRKNAP